MERLGHLHRRQDQSGLVRVVAVAIQSGNQLPLLEKAMLAFENVAFGEIEMVQDRLAVHSPSIHLFRVAPTPRGIIIRPWIPMPEPC